ncbi:MAG: TGS domain-containing protein [Chloroflexota bacterium]|jgi:ribosome-interacting GTPase 1
MPTNLPPQYFEAEKAFRQAKTPQDKIEALENMLAIMPKHKGTDHLRAELRARIAKLTEEAEQKKGAGRTQLYHVPKEGAGQVALVGPPNAGKSQLMAALTGANPKIGPYPFTTQLPQPAMMPFENVLIQLVDLPPVVDKGTPGWMRPAIRYADLLALVVDLSVDPLTDYETLQSELAAMRIEPVAEGEGMDNDTMIFRKKAVLVANKLDEDDARENLELLEMDVAGRLPLITVSAVTGEGLDQLRRLLFEKLNVIRVYTKPPGKDANLNEPTVLKAGSTVDDLAALIHKEIKEKLKYAVLWGSGKFQSQRIGRKYVLKDGDIVELLT